MTDRLTELGVRLRDFRSEDIPASVDISNRTWPDDPSTVEEEEYHEKTYPPDNPRLRLVVENAEGKFIGMGVCLRPFWMRAPGVYFMWIMLDPDWRRRGIGQALLPQSRSVRTRARRRKIVDGLPRRSSQLDPVSGEGGLPQLRPALRIDARSEHLRRDALSPRRSIERGRPASSSPISSPSAPSHPTPTCCRTNSTPRHVPRYRGPAARDLR